MWEKGKKGVWETNSRKTGKGVETLKNGDTLKGSWRQGKKFGKFVFEC